MQIQAHIPQQEGCSPGKHVIHFSDMFFNKFMGKRKLVKCHPEGVMQICLR